MKLTTRFLCSLGIFTGFAALPLSCGDSQKADESGGVGEAGSAGAPQGGTNGSAGTGNESGDGGNDRGGGGGSAGTARGGSGQGGDPGASGAGGSDDGGTGSGAGGEGAEPGTGGSAGATAGGGMGGMAGAGMAGGAGTLGGAGTGAAAGAGGMAGTGISGSAGAGSGGMSGQGGVSGAAGSGGAGGTGGSGGMGGTGGGPPPGCFRIDPLSWVRTRYVDYPPYPWGMQDGATAITVARYNWVGWFEYDISFPSTGNYRITVRTADDGWHEGLADELYNHFAVLVAGTTRLDFDANVSAYDDGASAVGDLRFHDATGPVFAATAGSKVVHFDNIADRWVGGDDIQIHIAYIQICSVP